MEKHSIKINYLKKEIEDYGPMKVRLYDGSIFILVAQKENRFVGKWTNCKGREYKIKVEEIREILD